MRDPRIDTLRGIACILLVSMHVIGHDTGAGMHVADTSLWRWYTEAFAPVRMPLFSFLAGFVYVSRPLTALDSYGAFLLGKARRLLVPYVVFVPLIGIAQVLLPRGEDPPPLEPARWMLYAISPYWFLLATFWIFAVVALMDGAGWLQRRSVVAATIAVLAATNMLTPVPSVDLLQIGNALSLATFFVAGLAAARFGGVRVSHAGTVAAAVTTVALMVWVQLGLAGIIPPTAPRISLAGIVLGVAFPLAAIGLGLRSRGLAALGHFSAGVYLVHPFTVAGTGAILGCLGVTDQTVLFAAGTTAGLLGSIVVVRLMRTTTIGRIALGERPSPRRRVSGSLG